MNDIKHLRQLLTELGAYAHAQNVLNWDQRVHMPKNGAESRSEALAVLAKQQHKLLTSEEFEKCITGLFEQLKSGKLNDDERCIVEKTWHDFNIAKKRPASFVERWSQAVSKGYIAWVEAREKNDFKLFAPELRVLVDLAREDAKNLGYKNNPYDALIDLYEPGTTVDDIDPQLQVLKDFLVPFLKEIAQRQALRPTIDLSGNFPKGKQAELGVEIVKTMGYDFQSGRVDETVHPFCTTFAAGADVRITTRFKENDLMYALSSTIHESGHAIYEQNMLAEHINTPLAEPISMAIHESQSRLWENIVGKGLSFWKHWYPRLQELFPEPFSKIDLEDFVREINRVQPSFIRTEADEVTYNLHIIIRYEIEKALIGGEIEIEDLPELWNQKYKDYLEIEPKSFTEGVLQDVHWAEGYFGYFPTYALGNLYSAQIYATAKRDIPDLEAEISKGNLQPLTKWLNAQIHQHGKRYTADEMIKKVSGEPLNAKYFIDYLKGKYNA